MANGRNGRSNGLRLDWQNLIMTIGLLVVVVGGLWTLAVLPLKERIIDLQQQVNDQRNSDTQHFNNDDVKFLTQKEHLEFKNNIKAAAERLAEDVIASRNEIAKQRAEAITRADAQNLLNTTRLEFLAEIKRLDQLLADDMKRKEFEAWKAERDKTIATIHDRQNRFSEALDSLYSKITMQPPSYNRPQ